ncbi:HAD family hydrolase [Adhaeribacter radiodurans]|uniref:HAD family hydrolase n=1 Tax=Adhaeribacter radiodurans TaxID=2745197 RepID=A0A7L7L825_9BACT|nr:HAD family hydrolase [Adhaeribacter radiodurans]QMU28982.1 HAD family hydrolase [Adhaeribacter radiodurans]
MVLVFDLDDTLYEEITFVKSGFKAVANYLAPLINCPEEELFTKLLNRLEAGGRGSIFNDVLTKYGKNSQKLVTKCLSIYRLHAPEIQLYPDAIRCLERFRHYPLYVVTDGNKLVQQNKVKALHVSDKVKKVFITHRFGIKNAKPSVYCFELIGKLEKTEPANIVYIGDNPSKDFVGLKPLGFKTIRIMRGNYRHLQPGEAYEADRNILSLDEITEEFLKNL